MQSTRRQRDTISYKHLIGELIDQWKGYPGFVLGNGISKRALNINALKQYGPIMACNYAFTEHHVDYLGHRDSKVRGKCLNFKGAHIMMMTKYGRVDRDLMNPMLDRIYFYETTNPRKGPDIENSKLVMGSTGNCMIQFAKVLGCNPVYLSGFDGCAIDNISNCYIEGGFSYSKKYKGYQTASHLLKFIRKTKEWCNWLNENGVETYKIGHWGILDIPTVDPKELGCLK
jgi:hypothetical protein